MTTSLVTSISFIDACDYCDFMLDAEKRSSLRDSLRGFGELLTDDSSSDFGAFRSKMETIVFLVVNDALPNAKILSFKEAIGKLNDLSLHHRVSSNTTAENFLRSVRWAIEGFKVFKNMDTHGLYGENLPDHKKIIDNVKRHWLTLAYTQMQTIVYCLKWLHHSLMMWKPSDDSSPKGRLGSPHYSKPARPPPSIKASSTARDASPPPAHQENATRAQRSDYSPHGGRTSSPFPKTTRPSPLIKTPTTSRDASPEPAPQTQSPDMSPEPVQSPTPTDDTPVEPSQDADQCEPEPWPRSQVEEMVETVYAELKLREELRQTTRKFYMLPAKCARPGPRCLHGHSAEEVLAIGVARAFAIGDKWKTLQCTNDSSVCKKKGCDFLHEYDDPHQVTHIKALASELRRHSRKKAGGPGIHRVELHDGRTVMIILPSRFS